jgi:hypothetical protein
MKMKKHCRKCGKTRAKTSFGKNRSERDGLQQYCKACTSAYHRGYYAGDPEAARASSLNRFQKFYASPKGRATHMLNNARKRAQTKKVAFDLTREWVAERLEAGVCEVTGLKFTYQAGYGRSHNRINAKSPSIDRIDPNGGYTTENSRMVVWIFNRARGAFPDGDFDEMIAALAAKAAK